VNNLPDGHDKDMACQLNQLYVELDAVEDALTHAMFRVASRDLYNRRAELLGKIKKLERKRNA